MKARRRLVILCHESDDFDKGRYLAGTLREHWRKAGWDVVIHTGTGAPPDADVALLHVNLSVVDPAYLRLCAPYPVVLNQRVTDITKRAVSSRLVTLEDDFDGPLIIKTNANCWGMPEAQLAGALPATELNWSTTSALGGYPIVRDKAGVPPGVWTNPHLVVEKFLPERTEDGAFALRVWVFLGSQSFHYTCLSRQPVIKGETTFARSSLGDIPQALREVRERAGFDYGKFDYVLHDGEVVLLDTNKTPGHPRPSKEPADVEAVRQFSHGLEEYCRA